jgi:hypothetical protein
MVDRKIGMLDLPVCGRIPDRYGGIAYFGILLVVF